MIELPSEVKAINKRLQKLYPNTYRIVFSDNEFEDRKGEFNIYFKSIFLRTDFGVHIVKKYSYIKSRFIIEKFVPPPLSVIPEIPGSIHGSWEPLYVFEDSNGNYLKPIMKVALMICNANQNPVGYWERKNQLDKEKEKQDKDDYNAVADEYDVTPVEQALNMREATVVPNKEIKFDE